MANNKTSQDKQTKRLNFRLTMLEYEKLQQSANTYGLTVSSYAKQLALKSNLRKPYFPAHETQKIILELARQGSNLNQIARNLNQGAPLEPKMLHTLTQIQEVQRQLWLRLQR